MWSCHTYDDDDLVFLETIVPMNIHKQQRIKQLNSWNYKSPTVSVFVLVWHIDNVLEQRRNHI